MTLRCEHGDGCAEPTPQRARRLVPGDPEQEVSVRLGVIQQCPQCRKYTTQGVSFQADSQITGLLRR